MVLFRPFLPAPPPPSEGLGTRLGGEGHPTLFIILLPEQIPSLAQCFSAVLFAVYTRYVLHVHPSVACKVQVNTLWTIDHCSEWWQWLALVCMSRKYHIAGNFRGRKLSRISRFFSHLRKFSPRNSRHATPIMLPFRESFLREMLLSTDPRKFFPSKISRYMVRGRLELCLIVTGVHDQWLNALVASPLSFSSPSRFNVNS